MDASTINHPASVSVPIPIIHAPRPTRLFNFDAIMDAAEEVEINCTGYVNPSYWRVGGIKVRTLEANLRNTKLEFDWWRHREALAKNPDSNAPAPWPPFVRPQGAVAQPSAEMPTPADDAAEEGTARLVEVGTHPVAESPRTIHQQVPAIMSSDSAVHGGRLSTQDGSMTASVTEGSALSLAVLSTPPGLVANDAVKLARIEELLRWQERLRRGRVAVPSRRCEEDIEEATDGVVDSMMRYLELG